MREIERTCMLMRTRLLSRIVTSLYDDALRAHGVSAPQFALLALIFNMRRPTRAEIGRALHQDRSTLTRNLRLILSAGWAEEVPSDAGGRARPLMLTRAGEDLVRTSVPAWRAAQAQARAVLGPEGVAAIAMIADRLIDGARGP
jgi:DNA-binding MarR family transcriptional regulator